MGADPIVRHKLAHLATEIQVGRLLCYRIACLLNAGKVPNLEAAMAKCYNSELVRRVAQVGLSIMGLHGTLSTGEHSVLRGRLQRAWLSLSDTYAAGPVEIMRNVIAIRGLGLPRG
jgi:alkylation response protein AidB-like acyl-CoA dehydrogenase